MHSLSSMLEFSENVLSSKMKMLKSGSSTIECSGLSDYWNHFVIVLFFHLKGLTILETTVFATPGYREACNDLEFLSSFERLDRQALCDRHLVRVLGLENSSNASEVWPQNLRYLWLKEMYSSVSFAF